jgi:hypothetical protein
MGSSYDLLKYFQQGVYTKHMMDTLLAYDSEGLGLLADYGQGNLPDRPLPRFFCQPFKDANLIREKGEGFASDFKFRELSGAITLRMRVDMEEIDLNEAIFDYELRYSDDEDEWVTTDTARWHLLFMLRVTCLVEEAGQIKFKC